MKFTLIVKVKTMYIVQTIEADWYYEAIVRFAQQNPTISDIWNLECIAMDDLTPAELARKVKQTMRDMKR